MIQKLKFISILLCILIFNACSDNVPPSTTTLTQKQADEVARRIAVTVINNYFEGADDPQPIERTDPCGGSGSLHSTGTIQQSGSFSFDLDHKGCVAIVDSDNKVTFSGLVKVSGSFTAIESNMFRYMHSASGSVDVSGPQVTTGTCGVDYQVEIILDSNLQNLDTNVSGTICNVPITTATFD